MRSVEVYTKDVYELCKNGYNSRDVGEHYLGGMITEQDDIDVLTGEGGFALRVFENALDWTVGRYIIGLAKGLLEKGKWYRFKLQTDGRRWYRTSISSGQQVDITKYIVV